MLNYKIKEELYNRTFKISLIISLLLLILFFYLFPRFSKLSNQEIETIDIKIYVSDIPKTSQVKQTNPPPPAKPYGFIPVPAEEADFPEELSLSQLPGTGLNQDIVVGMAPETPPKPILEVLFPYAV